jgi:hypothetical protein
VKPRGATQVQESSTCAGLGLKLRNITPDYKLCSHVAFRGALGYRGTLRCMSDSGDKQSALKSESDQTQCAAAVAFLFEPPQKPRALEV